MEEFSPLDLWKRSMAPVSPCSILWTGAKAWPSSVNADHSLHVPHATWTGTDIAAGEGVDIVADLQRIDQDSSQRFDGIFSPATLEHIERPWCAMLAMSNILKPGGFLYLHTHQTFPVHGYPSDYFRFSTNALRTLCYDAGLTVLACEYDSPCTITPPPSVPVWDHVSRAFLNVTVCASK